MAQMEERMATAGQAIRDAGFRALAEKNHARGAETAAGAAGASRGTAPTALVDTKLWEKPRTFSGALDWN